LRFVAGIQKAKAQAFCWAPFADRVLELGTKQLLVLKSAPNGLSTLPDFQNNNVR
jgi:hypothetical protein